MRGIFRMRPTLPRYAFTWDPELVLNLLQTWGPSQFLSLKNLSFKLVTLLALCQPKRVSELAAFDLSFVQKSDAAWCFHLPLMTKTRKIGALPDKAVYSFFPLDSILCPVRTLQEYEARTASFRASTSALLLSYRAPHKPITSQTVSRWITSTLASAGIDVTVFKAHSTRSAATSKVLSTGFPLQKVLQAGAWSDKSNTFARFYFRPSTVQSTFSGHLLRYSFEHAV